MLKKIINFVGFSLIVVLAMTILIIFSAKLILNIWKMIECLTE